MNNLIIAILLEADYQTEKKAWDFVAEPLYKSFYLDILKQNARYQVQDFSEYFMNRMKTKYSPPVRKQVACEI